MIENSFDLLIEAEHFDDQGGWLLDSQFIEEMGSPYLLAHGLGQPVANAGTTVHIPQSGEYKIWVRAKDWVPSHHPGRFQVKINGRMLDTEFGSNGRGWSWEKGGVLELAEGDISMELCDLTGFDGRCDAIFLTMGNKVPPEHGDEGSRAWRRRLLGLPDQPSDLGNFDFVVVGGGVGGCAAALSAARLDCRVALIHNRPGLGGNASAEIGLGPSGVGGPLVDELTDRCEDGELRALSILEAESNVSVFLDHHILGVVMDGDRIVSVDARHAPSSEDRRFHAAVFADCSGIAALGLLAGAETRFGQEARSEFDESIAPETADEIHHGNTVLFRTRMADEPMPFPDVPWARAVAKDYACLDGQLECPGKDNRHGPFAGPEKLPPFGVNADGTFQNPMSAPATHFWEYGQFLDPYLNGEHIRDHLLCAIYGTFANVKTLEPEKYANLVFDWVGHVPAGGEYRRLVGDYTLTENDIRAHRDFADAVVMNAGEFCLHYPGHEKYDFRLGNWEYLYGNEPYSIPFRCLYSRNISNLMMAGKHISVTHVASSSTKKMGNCGQHGIAVGTAAYLCAKHDTTPRAIGEEHIQEIKEITKNIKGNAPDTERTKARAREMSKEA